MIPVAITEYEPTVREEIGYLKQREAGAALVGWSDKVWCIGLLLKPINQYELKEALERYRRRSDNNPQRTLPCLYLIHPRFISTL